MSVNESSRLAYKQIAKDGTLTFQEQLILTYIQRNPKQTRRQVAKALDLDTSTVSGRVNGLLEKRLVTDTKKGKCPLSGKTVGLLEVL